MRQTTVQTGGTSAAVGQVALTVRWAIAGAAVIASLGGCTGTATPVPMMMISHGQAAGQTPSQASARATKRARGPTRKITREELTQRLMAFADRYIARISEATDQLEREAADPQARRAAHATKFFPASAMLTFAAEPDPVAGMLDMLTVATLERMVWQDTGWAVEVFGAKGAGVLRKAQVDAEHDIWTCAAAVMPPDRLRDVRQVIEDWQHAHPDRKYVSTMRFDDFAADGGDIARRAAVAARSASGGFLAPINEATRAVDETRMWGERFTFITARMQRMMSWQAKLFVYELALTPEAKQILANHQLMAEGVMRFGAAVEAWPVVIAREREALLKGFGDQTGAAGELVKSFRAALAEAQPVAADVRRTGESAVTVAAELRAMLRDSQPLLEEVARLAGKAPPATPPSTAPAAMPIVASAPAAPPEATPSNAAPTGAALASAVPARAAFAAASPVDASPRPAAAHEADPSAATPARGGVPPVTAPAASGAKAFDVKEYESLVREMNTLVNSSQSLLASRAWQSRLNEVNSAAEVRVSHASREGREMINYGFQRGILFAVFCAALLFATALLYRLTVRRLFPQPPRPPV